MHSGVQQKFYNLFWSNEACQDMFLLHKEELLQKEEIPVGETKKHFYLKRFVISNSLKRPDAIPRIEKRLENRTIELNSSLQAKSDKNLPEVKIEEYFNKIFGQPIKLISEKLNGNSVTRIRFISEIFGAIASEKKLMKFLKKYKAIPENIDTLKDLGKAFDSRLETEMKQLLKSEHFADMMTAFDDIANHYSNYNYYSLLEAHDMHTDAKHDKELYKESLEMYDSLYECRAFEGGIYKAYYECTSCDINVFCGNVTLNVTPSKVKLKCPNCSKEVFYLAPYKINDDIYNDIISKDGLLAEAVAYLLTTQKIAFSRNMCFTPDIELDFFVMNKENRVTDVVELKMYKLDRPEDVLISNLNEGLRRFEQVREKLIAQDAGYVNVKFHFLSNLDDEMINELNLERRIAETNIHVHNMKSFAGYFRTFPSSSRLLS